MLLKQLLKSVRLKDTEVKLEPSITSTPSDSKNIAGLGGQSFNPAFISWDHLYRQSYAELRQYQDKPRVIKEYLFFAYFGPLEAWCERNCQSKFLLWSTEHGIYRYFDDPIDNLLWNLTWDKPMPTVKELEQAR
jgi:hypothetical protein